MSDSRDKNIHEFDDVDSSQVAHNEERMGCDIVQHIGMSHQASVATAVATETSGAASIPETQDKHPPCVDDDAISSRRSVRLTHRSGVSTRSRMSLRNGGPRPWPDPNKYNERSFFLFTLNNSFRRTLIACIEWPWWDRTVLFVILINTVVLAMNDPYDIPQLLPISEKRAVLELLSKIFSVIFTLECAVKLLALGFFYGRRTYLSDSWNYLDFFIVVIGLLDFFPSGGAMGNLSAIRSLRVMRPLRAITKFPQLKFLVLLLFQCIPMLGNVIGLLTFIFFIFGILGVQLFGGLLRGSCYNIDSGFNEGTDDGRPCSAELGHRLCSRSQECLLLFSNPNNGATSFDSIYRAFMSIFQVMCQEGWTDVLYAVQDAYLFQMWTYFVALIFIGPIFAVQLFLVVISTKYAAVKEDMKKVDAAKLAKAVVDQPHQDSANARTAIPSLDVELPGQLQKPSSDGTPAQAGDSGLDVPPAKSFRTAPVLIAGISMGGEQKSFVDDGHTFDSEGNPGYAVRRSVSSLHSKGLRRRSIISLKKGDKSLLARLLVRLASVASSSTLENLILAVIVVNTMIMAMDHACDLCTQSYCAKYKGVLEGTNVFFAAVFLFEFLIKVSGFGIVRYFTVTMNWLDVAIVAVGLIEMPSTIETAGCLLGTPYSCQGYYECEGSGGVSVLRTFRLVRVVKLLRAFPDMQKQIMAVVSTLGSVAALVGLIFIFLLIFCILGMNLMGGQVLLNWSPSLLELGADVFVQIPGDNLETVPFPVQGRRGTIVASDFFNHSLRPWKVKIRYGELLLQELPMLDASGSLWAQSIDFAGINTPAIVGVMERDHFDDLYHASIATFGILTISNWNFHMYNTTYHMGIGIFLYYCLLIVVGNWMLLNLFIAILIQGFAEEKQKKLQGQKAQFAKKILEKLGGSSEEELSAKLFALFEEADADNSGLIDITEMETLLIESGVEMSPKDLFQLFSQHDKDGTGTIDFSEFFQMIKELIDDANLLLNQSEEGELGASAQPMQGSSAAMDSLKKITPAAPIGTPVTAQTMTKVFQHANQLAKEAELRRRTFSNTLEDGASAGNDAAVEHAGPDHDNNTRKTPKAQGSAISTSLSVLSPNNKFRRACKAFLDFPPERSENKWFDMFILACILASSCSLAVDNPDIGSNSPQRFTMNNIDLFLNLSFLLECCLKVIVLSFRVYIRNGWNRLDFLIVISSCLDMGLFYGLAGQKVNLAALKIFRILRVLRALRPLRIIARSKGLKVLVGTLMSAAKPIGNTLCIALGVFGIFGILGMQLLSGKLNACSDKTVFRKEDCIGVDDNSNPRVWATHPVNFDHIFHAIMAMFILATQDDWQNHMWAGTDATNRLTGPIQNNHPGIALFYICCIMVAGYLVVNIFVGVFVDSYNMASDKMVKESAGKREPRAKLADLSDGPASRYRRAVCAVVTTTNFDLFIALFIVSNVITMGFESFRQAKWQLLLGLVSNSFFSLAFGWECAFKLFGFYPRQYYKGGWNKFDFFIVMVTFAGFAIDSIGSAISLDPTLLRVLRIFRIFRILRAFRIFKAAKGLQAIIFTLVNSLPALANLFAMLGLFFFIFGVLGVTLFGPLCTIDDVHQDGLKAMRCILLPASSLLDTKLGFRNIGLALLTLFRVATGDGWGVIMYACSLNPPERTLIPPAVWKSFHLLNQSDANGTLQKTASYMDMVKWAIRGWNTSVTKDGIYMTDDSNWPYPVSAPAALDWATLARDALKQCMTEDEAYELEQEGFLDCSVGGFARSCPGTCGDLLTANLYFFFFCVVASFILLQLVIAVLMQQLSNTSGKGETIKRTPGCFRLKLIVFARMYRRWRVNALNKLQHLSMQEKKRKESEECVNRNNCS